MQEFFYLFLKKDLPSNTLKPIFVKYPQTKSENIVDTYFNTPVKDPYRWLEDDRSEETKAWEEAQNQVTENYLGNIPFRNKIKERLSELWNYEKRSAPFKEGNYIYFSKNDGLQNQNVVYRQKENEAAEVFLDPNT